MADFYNIFGEQPSYIPSLLGEDEADRLRRSAQQSGLMNLGLSLLAGAGPQPQRTGIGQLLAQGVMAGQQASRNAYEQAVRDKLMQQQLADMAAKQQRQAQMREIFPQLFTQTEIPGQEIKTYQSMTPQQIESAVGKPGFVPPSTTTVIPGKKQLSIDTNKLQALAMLSEDPLAGLASIAKIVPELRKAGFAGEQGPQDNPFAIFATDPTLPSSIRNVAQQYQASFARGLIDPEKVDERIRQLGDAATRAETTRQGEQLRRDQMAQSAAIAAGQQALTGAMVDIRRTAAEDKAEQARAKIEEKEQTKQEAKDQLTNTVDQLKKNYDTLLQEGGIVSTRASSLANISAKGSSNPLGRAIGAAIGTKAEEQRQSIEQTRPLLVNLIKNATGMSATQMNSNAEMQQYLNAATNPSFGYEANMAALANLDRLFGLGSAAKRIEEEMKKDKSKGGQTRSGW